MERTSEPGDLSEREVLLGWLAFHRDALAAKCEGLAADELVLQSVSPSTVSLLGLVRHLTEMERVYLVYALGGGELTFVYGPYDEENGQEPDFLGLDPTMIDESFENWHRERAAADSLIARFDSLDSPGAGNGASVRGNVIKVIQEYARHNGHADLVREAIDGMTGE